PRAGRALAVEPIWCELLRLDGVGLDDNFMLLGGDSLLAMEMIHLVEERLGFRLDGMDVLRESLWILARIIDGSGRPAPGADDAAAPRVTRDILPVSAFYFGPDETLYGLYTEPLGKATGAPVRAVHRAARQGEGRPGAAGPADRLRVHALPVHAAHAGRAPRRGGCAVAALRLLRHGGLARRRHGGLLRALGTRPRGRARA